MNGIVHGAWHKAVAAAAVAGLLCAVSVSAAEPMTAETAEGQVQAALDALEAGVDGANLDLAVIAFAGDSGWRAQQRRELAAIVERLQGHGTREHHRLYYSLPHRLAELCEETGHAERSLEVIRETAKTITPDDLRLRLAETAGRMGEAAKARHWYEALLESDSDTLAALAAERLKGL